MSSLHKLMFSLVALAAISGVFATPAAAQLSASCSGNFPTVMTLGASYSLTCTASGGSGTYSWIPGGTGIAGMSYSATMGSSITLSGNAVSAGSFTLSIQVSDGATVATALQQATYTVGSSGGGGTGASATLASISPTSAAAGAAFFLTLNGTGFVTGDQVQFGSILLNPNSLTSTQITVQVPAAAIPAATSVLVSVTTPTGPTGTQTFTVTGGGGGTTTSAVLSSISPTTAPAGTSVLLTLNGSGFVAGNLVLFGSNTALSPTTLSSTQMTVQVPASYLAAAGSVPVSVFTALGTTASQSFTITGGGSTSGTLPITCNPSSGPTTTGVSFSQTCSVTGGTPPYSWTVSGIPSGFNYGTSGSSTTISGIPLAAGAYSYTVKATDSTQGTANFGTLTVNGTLSSSSNGGINVTQLVPNSAVVGSGQFNLTVNGSGFVSGATVLWNNLYLATMFVSSSQLTATVPSSLLVQAGTATVVVSSSGVLSNSSSFSITSSSTGTGAGLTLNCSPGVGPSAIQVSYTQSCSVTGGVAPYNWSISGAPSGVGLVASTGSTATVSGTPTQVGNYGYTLTVTDSSSPAGSGSQLFAGQINGTATGSTAVINSISPTSAPTNSPDVILTVNGSGFDVTSKVIFNGGITLLTTFVNSNQVTAIIPHNQMTFPVPSAPVYVTSVNGNSNQVVFTVGSVTNGPSPLTIVCNPGVGPSMPNTSYAANCSVFGGTSPYTWSIVSGSLPTGLNLSSSAGVASITGITTLTGSYSYTLQASDSASHTATVQFAGQSGTGATSGLTLTSATPAVAPVGSADLTIQLIGTGFGANAKAYLGTSGLATNYLSPTQLTAVIPASLLATAQNATLTVVSGGLTSNGFTFSIGGSTSGGSAISITCNPNTGPPAPGYNYITTCQANGGKAPYTWTVSGNLPTGIQLTSQAGVPLASISGFTTVNATYSYTLVVSDGSSPPLTASFPFSGSVGIAGGVGGSSGLITDASPIQANAGSPALSITFTGSGFTQSSVVQWNGTPLNTGYVSPTQLIATVPASLLANAVPVSMQVSTPGVGITNAVGFNIIGTSTGQVSPATLTFNYAQGGGTPSAQTVSVLSGGTAGNFSVTPAITTTVNNFNWLSVTPASGTTPGTFAVLVTPGSLPVGQYTATLTVQILGGASSTIPVTLNIAGPPALVVSPNPITFTGTAGGADLTQTVKVSSSDGVTVLPYAASVSTNNGGNWLTVTPATGNTPGTITVTASPSKLGASTYSGTLILNATGTLGSLISVPVNFVVSQAPILTVAPAAVTFSAQAGAANPAAQTVAVTSSGSATAAFTATAATSSGGNWLSVTPGSGNTPGSVSISTNTSGLAAGTYNGTVTIAAPGASNTPQTIAVTLTVTPQPAITVAPSTLTFSYQGGAPNPAAQTVNITGAAGPFNYTTSVTTASGGNWLSVANGSGTTPGAISVSVTPGSLATGTYTGSVTVTASGANNSPQTIGVTLNVSAPPTLNLSATTLTFNAQLGGTAPVPQGIALSSSGTPLDFTASAITGNGVNWLAVSPTSGTTPANLAISVVPGTLAAGSYSGTVTISAPGASTPSQTVAVTLVITPQPTITVAPLSLSFNLLPGDTSPQPQSISVFSNVGAVGFTASATTTSGGSWLNVFGATQTQTPGSLAVTVNPDGLSAGQTYSGTITISAPTAAPTSVSIPVTLTLAAGGNPTLQVAPSTVLLSYNNGATVDAQRLTILNTGGGTLTYTAQAQSTSCGNWLTLLNPAGAATPQSPGILGFTVTPTGTSQTCRAVISITDGGGNTTSVPVAMTVSSQFQSIQLSQTAMRFQAVANAAAPAAQSFQVLNAGVDLMQWSVDAHSLSGGNWLSVSPATGVATSGGANPAPVTVSVNPAGLAPGTYYGTVRATSSTASNNPQILTVAFSVVPADQPVSPQITPTAIILTGNGAGNTVDTQTITVSNPSANAVTYAVAASSDDVSPSWLLATPATGSIAAGASASLSVTASLTNLTPGLRHGTLRIGFSDGSVQTVDVVMIVTGSGGPVTSTVRSCGAGDLATQFLSPSPNFQLPARFAVPLQVLVKDCTGAVATSANTSVNVIAGTGSVRMAYTGNGIWSGTYAPGAFSGQLTLTASAVQLKGAAVAIGAVNASGVITPAMPGDPAAIAAVVNAASFQLPGLIAPLTMVSIFGNGLADAQQTVFSTPFPTTLQGAQFTVADKPLPVFYVSDTQVNAVMPSGLTPNERYQLSVVRDLTQSSPIDVLVADSNPGLFATNQGGTGQGAILVGGTSQIAGPTGIVPGAGPTTAGQYISIFAAGFGAVSNTPADGSPSTTSNPSLTAVTPVVTIGGVAATVSYAGLAPGEVGVYQINALVPAGVPTGNAVPVVVTMGNAVANPVTIAIK